MMANMFKKAMRNNIIVKPLAVMTTAAAPVAYIMSNMSNLFATQPIPESTDLVAVSTEMVKSFQGSLLLLIIMMSIINIYKPSKTIIIALLVGGLSMLAANLLETIGITFLTYGFGLLLNSVTFSGLIARNTKLSGKKLDNEVDNIIKEARR